MPRGENAPSLLLSRDENEQVFSLIGPKCQSLATAVVQLFTTEGPAHSEWKKKDTGILCLIKDNGKRSYFFRIYCLYRKAMIWEHEVYIQIEYKSPRPYLHTFEAEEYMTAFNFANEDEARVLRNILIEKIEFRKQRREERRRRSELAASANNVAVLQNYTNSSEHRSTARHNGVTPAPPPVPTPVPKTSLAGNYSVKSSSKKPKTRKLTKADIGMPQDFKHISHVGWDANKGFDVDVDNLPEEEMRSFFSKAGISETQLQDQATREFIYDFINAHGGLDAVKEELQPETPVSGRAPAPPSTPAPAPPVPSRSPAPQQPPGPPSRAPPPPPARAVPPPPPPPAALQAPRNPPPPRPSQPPSTAPPSVPPPPPPPQAPPAGVPAPPPPPPLAPPPPPAPAPPPAPPAFAAPDPRAMLMESIRSGNKNLKHVEAGAGSRSSLNEDNRSNLLSEIRQGIELRSVPKETSNAPVDRKPEACGLAGALARALQERNRAIHSSDSDLSDETTSGGEWDD